MRKRTFWRDGDAAWAVPWAVLNTTTRASSSQDAETRGRGDAGSEISRHETETRGRGDAGTEQCEVKMIIEWSIGRDWQPCWSTFPGCSRKNCPTYERCPG